MSGRWSAGLPYVYLIAFGFLVVVLFGLSSHSQSTLGLANEWLIYSTVVVGFYFVFAVSGQFAFCQAAMMGIGAYTSALLSTHTDFIGAFFGGVAAAGVVAIIFALLVIRAGHFYFAIATLGLSQIVGVVLNQWSAFAGPGGLRLNIPAPSLFGLRFDTQTRMLWMSLGLLLIGLLLGIWIERSPMKREAVAFRDRELVAASLGLPIIQIRLQMFVLGSCYAAASGVIFADWQRLISPDAFDINFGIAIFLMLILGGTLSQWGGIAGAGFYVFVPDTLQSLNQYRDIVYGIILMVVIIRFPGGLLGMVQWALSSIVGLARRAPRPSAS